jgi:hypothetical protein
LQNQENDRILICSNSHYSITPWRRVLLEKLTGLQLVRQIPGFIEPEYSSPHIQAPATCRYPEPALSSPHTHISLPLSSSLHLGFPSSLFLLGFPTKTLYTAPPPYVTHAPPISFFLILSSAQSWVWSTAPSALHYVIFSIPSYLVPLRPKYSSQYPILKHPQPTLKQSCKTVAIEHLLVSNHS